MNSILAKQKIANIKYLMYTQRVMQKNPKIGYQGIAGAFSYLAAKKSFGQKANLVPVRQFENLFDWVLNEKLDYAVLPIENSLAGSIIQNYDFLLNKKVWVRGEVYLSIHHCLATIPESKLSSIELVYSHPKAIEQCSQLFKNRSYLQPVAYTNTATAARHVRDSKNLKYAAICSLESAEIYNLQVLLPHVENDQNNWTRFIVISRRPPKDTTLKDINKCSISYELPKETPGSLYRSLEPIYEAGVNLTNIESRPISGKFFEYMFYLDLEFGPNQVSDFEVALKQLKSRTQNLTVLGAYKKALPPIS